MLKYFQNKYNIKIMDPKQPLFVVKRKHGKDIYLPPELCLFSGLPSELVNDKNIMRELQKEKSKEPDERLDTSKILL